MRDIEYMEKLEKILFGLLQTVEDLVYDVALDEWDYQFHTNNLQELRDLAVDLQ